MTENLQVRLTFLAGRDPSTIVMPYTSYLAMSAAEMAEPIKVELIDHPISESADTDDE